MSNNPSLSTPVTRYLDSVDVAYHVFIHPGPVNSLEQAARERGQRPEQVVRSIVFRMTDGQFVMVLVAGAQQISWPRLREYLGVSRITMATPEEIMEHTHYPTGAVSPFGLPKPMRILVDDSIFQEEEVSIGSGVRYTTVIMHVDDLKQALAEVEVGKFS